MSRRKGSPRFPEAKAGRTDARAALDRIAADPATKLAAALQAAHVLRGDPAASPAPRQQPAPTLALPVTDEPTSPTSAEVEPSAGAPADEATEPGGEPVKGEPRTAVQDASDAERHTVPPHDATSAPPRTGMPRRDRVVAPAAEFQTTLLTFVRSEAEHALAHAGDLMRARSITEVADLQVSALARTTGASLTCFAALMRSVTGAPRRGSEEP